jgi:hypothetical protein
MSQWPSNRETVVEALIPITLFLSIAMVLILRPVTRKLGGLIEVITLERTRAAAADRAVGDAVDARTAQALEHVGRRLELIEERLDFTERLVAAGRIADVRTGATRVAARREGGRAEV